MLLLARKLLALAAVAAGAGCGSDKQPESTFVNLPDGSFGGVDSGNAMVLTQTVGYAGPTTCEQAQMTRSYIGCDYWPTVTANPVWSIFDFTAVVANGQSVAADVTVTGPNNVNTTVSVRAGGIAKIYLPWVPALKGPDCDACGLVPAFNESVTALASAYHLVSSVPVTVTQFNALEYRGAGGPPGKDWGSCPGSSQLCTPPPPGEPDAGGDGGDGGAHHPDAAPAPKTKPFYIGCFSYTNDASLLIPSTAMTGNYRVTGDHAIPKQEGSYFAVTAVTDDTHVTVTVSRTATVIGGGTVPATPAGGTMTLTMNSGDVIEVMSDQISNRTDISGSLVHADQPVQVIAGNQCSTQPQNVAACDHLESSVLPAETLGKDYVVTVPTSPSGYPVGHVVRFYGNVDGTVLTYTPSRPKGCPATLDAGQTAECVDVVKESFEVKGTHEFAVSSFQLGGSLLGPYEFADTPDGDPSMSPMVATEQYLQSYIFLAPNDYDSSFIDVVAPADTIVKLDDLLVTNPRTGINGKWSVVRIDLSGAKGAGASTHRLTATNPVGVQVVGYGAYTSYQYPAGFDLSLIAAAPLK